MKQRVTDFVPICSGKSDSFSPISVDAFYCNSVHVDRMVS